MLKTSFQEKLSVGMIFACMRIPTQQRKRQYTGRRRKRKETTRRHSCTQFPPHQSITRNTSSDTFLSSTCPLTEYLPTREIKSYNRTNEDSEDLAGRRRDRGHQKESARAAVEAIQEAKTPSYVFPHFFDNARRQECSSPLSFLPISGAMSLLQG